MVYQTPSWTRVWVYGRILDDVRTAADLTAVGSSGTVQFIPSPNPVLVPDDDVIMSMRKFVAYPDPDDGYFQVQLLSTDDPDINPTQFTYQVIEPTGRTYHIQVPYDTPPLVEPGHPLDGQPAIDLVTIVPDPNSNSGYSQLVVGPQGPPGPITSVNGDAGPAVVLDATDVGAAPTSHSHDHGTMTGLGDDDHPQYVLSAGDTMTGALTLSGAPSSNLHAATKQYVDTVAQNTVAAASYTLVLADQGKVVEMNNGVNPNTLTVPANSTAAFPVGTVIEVYQLGSGQTTIAAAGGVTLRAPNGLKLSSQYATASLRKRDADEWVISGDVVV